MFELLLFCLPVRVLVKNGSWSFEKRWFLCQAKPNVPFVRWFKIELK